ncbi:hypothetical protein DL770_004356 [Monosporascus sp. CRB-9-2]|nr:hypothetical protein DL770_004356 [Monosporascus sp. CRB-9-2]
MNTPASMAATLAGDTALFASVASTAAPSIRGADINNDDGCPDLEGLAQITKKLNEKGRPQYDDDPNIVGWDGPDDPECPRNWSAPKKFFFTAVTSSVILTVSFGSSVFAPATAVVAAQLGVSILVMRLGVTLWILGLAAGPVLFGPLSEAFGHLIPFAVATLGLGVFQLPVALGRNVQTVLVGRFLAGAFGSGSYAVISGMYYELYEPTPRGVAMAVSSTCINLGATVAPIAGAYLTHDAGAGWTWTAWVTLIITGVLFLILVVGVPESSSARILERRARRLRLETRNWALHARSEEKPREVGDIARRYLAKPARMFATEPVLVVFTAYLTLVYGTLYLAFQAFPLAYLRRGWSAEASQLPFLAVALGVASACALCSAFALTWYRTKTEAAKARGKPEPEWRLPPMALGAAVLPPALLWFGWSGKAHWASQVVAGYFVGCGLQLIFVAGITYVVDVYGRAGDANSAMSAHVVVRSLVASSFPLFADEMYDRLGVAWASSVLALLSLVMAPAPVLFWVYGARIRSWSRFSSSNA